MKKIIYALLLSTLITSNAFAKYTKNGFLIEEKILDFSHTIRSNVCRGAVPYPVLSHGDEDLIIHTNNEIHDFIELYAVCNEDKNDQLSVELDIPESGIKDYFSIRWITKKANKAWRIDVLTFNRDTGSIIEITNVFNMLSNNLMGEIIKLSKGHLEKNCNWEQFLEKVKKRNVQFYIKQKQWFLIFNTSPDAQNIVDVKIPEHFLKGGDHDRG